MKNGTVVEFSSFGSTYFGFIIGECSYDNCGENNAYVVRYIVRKDDDVPRKPYTIVAKDRVDALRKWDEEFSVCGHWSATPDDRCDNWEVEKDKETGFMRVVAVKE